MDLAHRRGSVGIAVRKADGSLRGFSSPRPGLDQTAHGAELWGLWIISVAIALAAVETDVFIDNAAVVHGGQQAWAGGNLPRRQPAAWHAIAGQARRFRGTNNLNWCPGHGKHPEWQAPPGFEETEIRDLNEKADEEASNEQRRIWALGAVARASREVQNKRTERALHRQHRGLRRQLALAGLGWEAAAQQARPARGDSGAAGSSSTASARSSGVDSLGPPDTGHGRSLPQAEVAVGATGSGA